MLKPIGSIVLEADQRQSAAENALNVVLQEQLRRERRFLGSYVPSSAASSMRSTPVGAPFSTAAAGGPRFGTPMSLTRETTLDDDDMTGYSARPDTATATSTRAGENASSAGCPLCDHIQRHRTSSCDQETNANVSSSSVLRDEMQAEAGYKKGSLSQTVRFCTQMVHQGGAPHHAVDASDLLLKLEAIETSLRSTRGVAIEASAHHSATCEGEVALGGSARESPLKPSTRSTGTNTPGGGSGDEQVASVLKRKVKLQSSGMHATSSSDSSVGFGANRGRSEVSVAAGPSYTHDGTSIVDSSAAGVKQSEERSGRTIFRETNSTVSLSYGTRRSPLGDATATLSWKDDSNSQRVLSDRFTVWSDLLRERVDTNYNLKLTLFHGIVMGSLIPLSAPRQQIISQTSPPRREELRDDVSVIHASPMGTGDSVLVATPMAEKRHISSLAAGWEEQWRTPNDRFVFSAKQRLLLDSEEDLRTTLEIEELHRWQELGNMCRIGLRRSQEAQALREGLACLRRQHLDGRRQIEVEQERLRQLVSNALLSGMLAIDHRRRQESIFARLQYILQGEGLTRIDIVAEESRIRSALAATRSGVAFLVRGELESRELLVLDQSRRRRDAWDRHIAEVSNIRRAEENAREERRRAEAEQERAIAEQSRLEGLRLEEEVRQERERRRRELDAHYEKTRAELEQAERANAAARDQWLMQHHAAITSLGMVEVQQRTHISMGQATDRREMYASFNRGLTDVLKWEEARDAADAQLGLEESRRLHLLRAAAARSSLRGIVTEAQPHFEAPPPPPCAVTRREVQAASRTVVADPTAAAVRQHQPVPLESSHDIAAEEKRRRRKQRHRHAKQKEEKEPSDAAEQLNRPSPPHAAHVEELAPAPSTSSGVLQQVNALQRENEELRLLLVQRQEERSKLLRGLREATQGAATTSPEVIQRTSSPEQPSLSPPREPQPLAHRQTAAAANIPVVGINVPTATMRHEFDRRPAAPVSSLHVSVLPEPHPLQPRPVPRKPRRNVLLQPPWNGSINDLPHYPRRAQAIPMPHPGGYSDKLVRRRSPGGTPHRYEVPTTSFLEQASLKYQVEYITDHWTQYGQPDEHRHVCNDRYCDHLGLH